METTITALQWDALAGSLLAFTRLLENRRSYTASTTASFRAALEGLDAEIRMWRHSMPCELTVICRAHRRKCYLEETGDLGGARVKHEPRVGEPVELCFSQRFLVRREFEYDRVVVLDELVGEFARQEQPQASA